MDRPDMSAVIALVEELGGTYYGGEMYIATGKRILRPDELRRLHEAYAAALGIPIGPLPPSD